nr:MAG TPA: hypothetical protein [Caudoviricetes sp.]
MRLGLVPEIIRLSDRRPGVLGTCICPIGRVKPFKGKNYLRLLLQDTASL